MAQQLVFRRHLIISSNKAFKAMGWLDELKLCRDKKQDMKDRLFPIDLGFCFTFQLDYTFRKNLAKIVCRNTEIRSRIWFLGSIRLGQWISQVFCLLAVEMFTMEM